MDRITTRRQMLGALGIAPLAAPAFGQGRCRDGYGTPGCPLTAEQATALIKPVFAPTGWKVPAPLPFASPGWHSVWLDHISYGVPNYKLTASFYTNLLGWKETYDEGSQHELLIGDVGDMIVRGGNPNDPDFGKAPLRAARIDHISYGISPWDTDGVKAALERRGLRAQIDTSTRDDIHVAAFKSYHTTSPNGYDLQISYLTHDTRLALANAVKPKAAK